MNGIGSMRLLEIALGAALIANGGIAYAGAPKAKFAYVASCSDDTVVQFKVKRNGLLKRNSPATATAGACPEALATVTLNGKQFVYANNTNDGTVSQYQIAANGTLTPLTPATVDLSGVDGGGLAFITANPQGSFVYATDFGPTVVQLKVNADGTLSTNTPASVTASGASTVFPLVDPSGKFLYVSEFGNNTVLQYKIGADGKLTANTPPSIDTGGNPRNLAITPSGAFVYVPNLNDGTISQYKTNSDGTLTANSPPTFNLPSDAGVTQVVVNNKGTFAFVPDENLNVVYQLKINSDGTLAMNSPGSVPVAFADLMTLDGGGKFAYVDDAGSLLFQFKVNPKGKMKPNPNSSNSINAGSFNGQILLVPGGR